MLSLCNDNGFITNYALVEHDCKIFHGFIWVYESFFVADNFNLQSDHCFTFLSMAGTDGID